MAVKRRGKTCLPFSSWMCVFPMFRWAGWGPFSSWMKEVTLNTHSFLVIAFFFYISVCQRIYFLLFLFCWFHCLLMDCEFCMFGFISCWSGSAQRGQLCLGETLEGLWRWNVCSDTWSEKKKKKKNLTLHNAFTDNIYFPSLKHSEILEDQVVLYCFPG